MDGESTPLICHVCWLDKEAHMVPFEPCEHTMGLVNHYKESIAELEKENHQLSFNANDYLDGLIEMEREAKLHWKARAEAAEEVVVKEHIECLDAIFREAAQKRRAGKTEAENARLREALERVVEVGFESPGGGLCDPGRRVAKAALAREGE